MVSVRAHQRRKIGREKNAYFLLSGNANIQKSNILSSNFERNNLRMYVSSKLSQSGRCEDQGAVLLFYIIFICYLL